MVIKRPDGVKGSWFYCLVCGKAGRNALEMIECDVYALGVADGDVVVIEEKARKKLIEEAKKLKAIELMPRSELAKNLGKTVSKKIMFHGKQCRVRFKLTLEDASHRLP